MSGLEQGAARRFVDASGLHADKTILHEVEPSDPVRTPEFVEPFQQAGRGQAGPVDRDGVSLLEVDFHVLRRIRSGFRRSRSLEHCLVGFVPGILQCPSFVGGVEKVGIG